ncbi:Vanin-like protein 3 [Portunus trituberculatus]|uniref:Vanin-like protein 3 n=1 Tax=Portunus trituberculatus TaxID=210409 RepID=A0A5B7JPW9_PORTR|nr:Vanin-like protein 3 [Portunus trituberculatus]
MSPWCSSPVHRILQHDNVENLTPIQVLRELSCGAAQLKLYLIVDLIELVHCSPNQILDCPDVGYYLYNTQVVLDRCGTLVARYRKKHLFLEAGITAGDESDATAVFTTDFGVTFTLQVH